jgi:plastocyanin
MKTIFNINVWRYFAISFLCTVLYSNLQAQTSQKVTVTSNQFTPKEITISAGDTVIWVNQGGNHNVDGQKTAYPSNPVSFGNSLGTGWTYKFVFTTPGTYNYKCDPHAAFGMVGKVTVNPGAATSSDIMADNKDNLKLYPNPASQYVQLLLPRDYGTVRSLKVYAITGAVVDEKTSFGNAENIRYDLSQYKKGIYLMEVNTEMHRDILKFMKQ